MRITSGELKGREIAPPAGSRVRPASGFVREMAMSIFGPERLESGAFADICAGSGVVGFEALSRGAPRVFFIDAERRQCSQITRHVEKFEVDERCHVICTDARRLRRPLFKLLGSGKLAAAFADPPFITGITQGILQGIGRAADLFAEDGLVILRSEEEPRFPVDGLELIEQRDANHGNFWIMRPLPTQVATNAPGGDSPEDEPEADAPETVQ